MKTMTTTKYVTSDGRSFETREPAQIHELMTFFRGPENDGTRVTAGEIIRQILDRPADAVQKIREVTADEPSE